MKRALNWLALAHIYQLVRMTNAVNSWQWLVRVHIFQVLYSSLTLVLIQDATS